MDHGPLAERVILHVLLTFIMAPTGSCTLCGRKRLVGRLWSGSDGRRQSRRFVTSSCVTATRHWRAAVYDLLFDRRYLFDCRISTSSLQPRRTRTSVVGRIFQHSLKHRMLAWLPGLLSDIRDAFLKRYQVQIDILLLLSKDFLMNVKHLPSHNIFFFQTQHSASHTSKGL